MFRQHFKPAGLIKSWTGVARNDAIAFPRCSFCLGFNSHLRWPWSDYSSTPLPCSQRDTHYIMLKPAPVFSASCHFPYNHLLIYNHSLSLSLSFTLAGVKCLFMPYCRSTVKTNKTQYDVLGSILLDSCLYNAF